MAENILPLYLRPHLVNFFSKEMRSNTTMYIGSECKCFEISKISTIGAYLLEHIEKSNYPVKDISQFNFIVKINSSIRRKFNKEGMFWKVERLGNSFVMLPEKYIERLNNILEEYFRNAFYNFVSARHQDNELLVTQSILLFIDKYDLFECGVSQPQLRQLYYRMQKNGLLASAQGKMYR